MIPVYLCDDEECLLDVYSKYVDNFICFKNSGFKLIAKSSNPFDILAAVKAEHRTGVYFLDINLNADINGIELARLIREYDPDGFIIFISTYQEKSLQILQENIAPLDFIIKDTIIDIQPAIYRCLEKVISRMENRNARFEKAITLKIGTQNFTIPLQEIISIQALPYSHRVCITTLHNCLDAPGTLNQMSTMLDDTFFKCHKSCIINLKHIRTLCSKQRIVEMEKGITCPVSTRCLPTLDKLLQN